MLAPLRNSARVTSCFSRKREILRRRNPVGRSAARQQHHDEIVGAGRVGELKRALGAGEPGCVRHRMAGLDHLDPSRRPAVAVTGDGDAGEAVRGDAASAICAR